jgi:hypothetical protein
MGHRGVNIDFLPMLHDPLVLKHSTNELIVVGFDGCFSVRQKELGCGADNLSFFLSQMAQRRRHRAMVLKTLLASFGSGYASPVLEFVKKLGHSVTGRSRDVAGWAHVEVFSVQF